MDIVALVELHQRREMARRIVAAVRSMAWVQQDHDSGIRAQHFQTPALRITAQHAAVPVPVAEHRAPHRLAIERSLMYRWPMGMAMDHLIAAVGAQGLFNRPGIDIGNALGLALSGGAAGFAAATGVTGFAAAGGAGFVAAPAAGFSAGADWEMGEGEECRALSSG